MSGFMIAFYLLLIVMNTLSAILNFDNGNTGVGLFNSFAVVVLTSILIWLVWL